ncbi:MAG: cytochrome c oxidase subunit II [Gemmatimonadetes bacterium]|nr:cytochrome c oxidase subunit II [Gemmatimonadota bacterium]
MSARKPEKLRFLRVFRAAPLAALIACSGEYPQTTFRTVTDFGQSLNDLFGRVFWWTIPILVLVEVVLLFVVIRYRRRPGGPTPKPVHGHTGLEMLWTLIPALIVVAIAVPTVQTIFATQRRAPDEALMVEVVGHQWWWEFRYPEQGVVTASELHLPAGRPVHLQLRSVDVIHSFWIPRLGGKRDTNPRPAREGQRPKLNHLTFTVSQPGSYLGQCAEFCGLSHAIMRMRAVVHTPEQFEAWAQRMQAPPAPPAGTLAERGREVFLRSPCIACHTVEGTTARGVIGPNLTLLGDRATVGAGALANTPENLARWIRDPGGVKPGAMMPGTRAPGGGLPPTGLNDADVEAVVAYLLSLRSGE